MNKFNKIMCEKYTDYCNHIDDKTHRASGGFSVKQYRQFLRVKMFKGGNCGTKLD